MTSTEQTEPATATDHSMRLVRELTDPTNAVEYRFTFQFLDTGGPRCMTTVNHIPTVRPIWNSLPPVEV